MRKFTLYPTKGQSHNLSGGGGHTFRYLFEVFKQTLLMDCLALHLQLNRVPRNIPILLQQAL